MVAPIAPAYLFPPDSTSQDMPAIKLLDLMTNRYHVGIVQAATDGSLAIEMPLSARLNAGQRVQFVLADDATGVIARRTMRTAMVRHVDISDRRRLRADLTMTAECVAA